MRKIIKSLKKRGQKFKRFLFNGKNILILSDSHGGVFEYIHDNHLLSPHYINAEIARGATAYGLSKEVSSTNAFEKFIQGIKRFKNYTTIVIQLGEVDCAFILWKKAEGQGKTPEEMIQYSINGYEKLIKKLIELKKTIIISGAILPTLKDNEKADDTAPLRNTISATQKERTNLILQFNLELQKLAKKYNLAYIDITHETLDKDTQVIASQYVRKDPIDYHQSFQATAPIWVKKLYEVLKK
jgi:hypothetical protein